MGLCRLEPSCDPHCGGHRTGSGSFPPARRSGAGGHRPASGSFPPADRSGEEARRQLLFDLSQMGDSRASRGLLPTIPRVSPTKTQVRSARTVPERLVSTLQEHVCRFCMTNPPRRLVWLLWMLLFAFCCRVLGQALVAFFDITWLPPTEEWYSGLMAYPLLLPTQVLIIVI